MATTRLGLFGVPRERYGTTKLVIGQSNKPDVTTATASGIGNVGAVTRLGISGVPGAAYKRFAAKTPTSAATHTGRSEEHTSELQSHLNLVCRLLLEKKKNSKHKYT